MSDLEEHDEHVFRLTRRKALKGLALGIGTMVLPAKDASASVWESFFQKNFRELNRSERQKILSRLEKEYSARYKKPVRVKDTPPQRVSCSDTDWIFPVASGAEGVFTGA